MAISFNSVKNNKTLKLILLKIGFIEKVRNTWGNKEVLQILFLYSHYPQK